MIHHIVLQLLDAAEHRRRHFGLQLDQHVLVLAVGELKRRHALLKLGGHERWRPRLVLQRAEAAELAQLLSAQEGEGEGLQRECDRLTQLLRAERAETSKSRAEAAEASRALEAAQAAEEELRSAMQSGRGELVQAQLP